MPPEVVVLKNLLDIESLVVKYLTLSLKFLAWQINRTIILGPKNLGSRTIILERRENYLRKCCCLS